MAHHAVRRRVDTDLVERDRAARALDVPHVAPHLRRLAQDHREIDVDRPLAELVVLDQQPAVVGGPAEHREGAAFALAEGAKALELGRRNREHVAFLRLVAPDLARRHAGVFGRDLAQLEAGAAARRPCQLGHGVGQSARADVVDRQDRIRGSQLPAAVDHLLRAALHLGVAALHRVEIQIRHIGARAHRGRRAAAHADQQAGAAELDQ